MRKTITSIFFVFLSLAVAGSVFAGDKSECEHFKKDKASKGAYGLCVAYQNADDAGGLAIFENWKKKFGPNAPVLPNSPNDVEDEPCPCWDFAALEEELACNSYFTMLSGMDESGNNSGQDFAWFIGNFFIQVHAGNTPYGTDPTVNECAIAEFSGLFTTSPYEVVSGAVEDQCRLDVLDFIAAVGDPLICAEYADSE
jgi:hypothetical protein